MWLRDYHVDGLRLDAVHALVDTRAMHLLEEMAREVDALSAALGRPLSLIAESDLNDPRLITPREAGGIGLTRAVERRRPPRPARAAHRRAAGLLRRLRLRWSCLANVLTGAFFHAGTWSSFRAPAPRPPGGHRDTSGLRFVAYLQNHDQIGNRATGDRLSATLSPGLLGSARRCCSPPRSPRCCSWARSGARAPRGSSSPATPSPSWPGRRRGPQRRVRRARLGRRRGARPAGPGDLHPLQAGLVRAGRASRTRAARPAPGADRAAPGPAGAGRPRLAEVEVVATATGGWWCTAAGCRVVANLAEDPREIDLDRTRPRSCSAPTSSPVVDGATVTLAPESAAVVQHPLTCAGSLPRLPRASGRGRAPRGVPDTGRGVAAGQLHRLPRRRDHRRRGERGAGVARRQAGVPGAPRAGRRGARRARDGGRGGLPADRGRLPRRPAARHDRPAADRADRRRLPPRLARPGQRAGGGRRLPHDPRDLRVGRRRPARGAGRGGGDGTGLRGRRRRPAAGPRPAGRARARAGAVRGRSATAARRADGGRGRRGRPLDRTVPRRRGEAAARRGAAGRTAARAAQLLEEDGTLFTRYAIRG